MSVDGHFQDYPPRSLPSSCCPTNPRWPPIERPLTKNQTSQLCPTDPRWPPKKNFPRSYIRGSPFSIFRFAKKTNLSFLADSHLPPCGRLFPNCLPNYFWFSPNPFRLFPNCLPNCLPSCLPNYFWFARSAFTSGLLAPLCNAHAPSFGFYKLSQNSNHTIDKYKMNWANKKATINMKCSDEESFKWAVARALNPIAKSSGRVTKVLRAQSKLLNWDGLDFPTPLEQIETFEKNNDLLVNVFGFDESRDCVTSLKLSSGAHGGRVLLMFTNNRYTVVKSMSRLFFKQATSGRRKGKRFYCNNCLQPLRSDRELRDHVDSFCLPFEMDPRGFCVTDAGDIRVLKIKLRC